MSQAFGRVVIAYADTMHQVYPCNASTCNSEAAGMLICTRSVQLAICRSPFARSDQLMRELQIADSAFASHSHKSSSHMNEHTHSCTTVKLGVLHASEQCLRLSFQLKFH